MSMTKVLNLGLRLLLLFLSLLLKSNVNAGNVVEVTFTSSHDPPNIAEGSIAVFNCSSNHSLVTITWILNETVLASTFTSPDFTVIGAGKPVSSLIVPGQVDPFNNTAIWCFASGPGFSDISPPSVTLKIQGKLASVTGLMSTQLNGSCYLLNWTPPFTLSGVHILNYNINVTDNNGNIIVQTNVSIAEWEYCPKKFGDLCISIAAVNEVGEGELNEIKLNATKYNIAQTQIHNRSRDENQNWILSITIILEVQLTGSDSEKQCIKDILMNCTDSNTSFNTSNITHITDSELMATFNISLERADDKNHTIITHIFSCSVLDEYESSKNNSLPISFFDVEYFSVSKDSDDVIAFTCKFVPGTQAKGCHIFMNHTITGRNYSVNITKENETGSIRNINESGDYQIKVYDINQDDIIPSIPAYISNVIIVSPTLSSFSSELITASLFTSPTMETPSPVNHNRNTVIIVATIVATIVAIVAIILVVTLIIVIRVTWYHHKKPNKIKAQKRKNSENPENSVELLQIKRTPQKADLKYIEIEPDPNAPPVPPPLDLDRTKYSEIQTRQSDTESFKIYSKLNHNSTNPNDVCIDSKNDTYSSLKHESNRPINNSCSSTPNFDRQISTQTDITEINCEVLPLTKKELTHKDLSIHVTPYLTEKWHEMGLALALTPPQLDDIEENNQGISDVFQLWEDLGTRPFTWETLLNALRSPVINESELADEISCK